MNKSIIYVVALACVICGCGKMDTPPPVTATPKTQPAVASSGGQPNSGVNVTTLKPPEVKPRSGPETYLSPKLKSFGATIEIRGEKYLLVKVDPNIVQVRGRSVVKNPDSDATYTDMVGVENHPDGIGFILTIYPDYQVIFAYPDSEHEKIKLELVYLDGRAGEVRRRLYTKNELGELTDGQFKLEIQALEQELKVERLKILQMH